MEENQEILFAQTLESVRKLARRQGNRVTGQQVREAFGALKLSEEQLGMVLDYLRQRKVAVVEGDGGDTLSEGGAALQGLSDGGAASGAWTEDALSLNQLSEDEELSEAETDYLEEYKRQLVGSDEISEGEKEAFTLSAMAGESDAQQRLIHLYLPKVVDIARLYAGQGVFLEDLIGEGNVALSMGVTMLGCLENAREAEGTLMKMVMDAMEEYITENEQEQDKDRKILDKVNKVAEKAKELAKELRRKVTVEELAAESGMSENAIRDAMRMSGFAIEDLEGR